jgi:hypothetical protein
MVPTVKEDLTRFFEILYTKEESDSGIEFSPVHISSCRVLLTQELYGIMERLESYTKEV